MFLPTPEDVEERELIHTWDFIKLRFLKMTFIQLIKFIYSVLILIIIISKLILKFRELRKLKLLKQNSIEFKLPDGTLLHQPLSDSDTHQLIISSPTSSKIMLIPSDAIHPYEVVTVGQSDSVELDDWQEDLGIFDS